MVTYSIAIQNLSTGEFKTTSGWSSDPQTAELYSNQTQADTAVQSLPSGIYTTIWFNMVTVDPT